MHLFENYLSSDDILLIILKSFVEAVAAAAATLAIMARLSFSFEPISIEFSEVLLIECNEDETPSLLDKLMSSLLLGPLKLFLDDC